MSRYIVNDADFVALCKRLLGVPVLGIDTEFVGEHSYYPRLALIQIAVEKEVWIVDPLKVQNLQPLKAVLERPDTTVVLHNGESDVPILKRATGAEITTIFDTQLAAAFAGMTEQTALATLVSKMTGGKIAKGQQVTDWLKRPLTQKQLDYAASDVLYLDELYHKLDKRLTRTRRKKAFEEESAIRRAHWLSPVDIDTRFKKSLSSSKLTPRRREATRRLLIWREDTAIRLDKPRRHVLRDEALAAIAQQLPRSLEELKSIRLFSDKAAKRYGNELVALCVELRKMPEPPAPARERRMKGNSRSNSIAPAVKMALQALADQAGIAPGLIARSSEIEELCRYAAAGENMPDLPCLAGWRGRLIGRKLWRFARGEATLRIGQKSSEPAVILEEIKQ